METVAGGLVQRGISVARFEFAYMAQRRSGGSKRPPPKMPILEEEYRAVLNDLASEGPVLIGGKSMGGRVASLIADDMLDEGQIKGVVCMGYPFHPGGQPDKLRTAHLEGLRTPTLICQGTRDALGSDAEVAGYRLSPQIRVEWFADGDHDLKPRKRETGLTLDDHLDAACQTIADWAKALS